MNINSRFFYDSMWEKYAPLDVVNPASFHRRRIIVTLANRYARKACSILDVGCGQGELLRQLSKQMPSAYVAGSDVSQQAIFDSESRNPGYHLFAMDLMDPSFDISHEDKRNQFDLVVCSEVLEHISDDRLAMNRLKALLSPGGVLIVTVPGGRISRYDQHIGHFRHYTREGLSGLFRSADLQIYHIDAWGFPFHSAYRTIVRIASKVALPPVESRNMASIPSLLGLGYRLLSRALQPLFYLNLTSMGEQLVGVACRV